MSQSATQARSDDIGSLHDEGLSYVEALLPDNALSPNILAKSRKSQTRGFLHPQMGALLCPVDRYCDYTMNRDKYVFLLSLMRN